MATLNWRSLLVGMVLGALLLTAAPVIAANGDELILGLTNSATARTTLRGASDGPNLKIVQETRGTPALALTTPKGTPPLKVNRRAKVRNLNADLLDGRHAGYFVAKVPRPGEVLMGGFGAAGGGEGLYLFAAVTFPRRLTNPIPQANITYIGYKGSFTDECPGYGLAAAGHLCIYATWSKDVGFSTIAGITDADLGAGASEVGFGMYWDVGGIDPNVRGHWVYTVPKG